MNLILLEDQDFFSKEHVRIGGTRLEHICRIHRAKVGDHLRVGRVGASVGRGVITAMDPESVTMTITLTEDPPVASQITLALALPRPPTLQKVLQHCTALGIKQFVFFNSRRVEKSFWQSSALAENALEKHMRLGLEQARDTVFPEVKTVRYFKEFVQEELPQLAQEGPIVVADPVGDTACPCDVKGPLTLVLGPEGGFIDAERASLREQGFSMVHLGPRILRVEAAAIALVARLSPFAGAL